MRDDRIYAYTGFSAILSTAVRFVSTSRPAAAVLAALQKRERLTNAQHQLRPYERRSFSQNGEDGIIKELLFRTGTKTKCFVEFGAQDGSECNTAVLAQAYGWSGLYIEADDDCYRRLAARYASRPEVICRRAFVTEENITSLLQSAGIAHEFDLLSIDIDGNDFWVWRALHSYSPRIVVVEYNAAYPPPMRWIIQYDPSFRWDGTSYFGAGLQSMYELGQCLGYELIDTDSRGINAFFLRRDLVGESGLQPMTPETAYHRPRYGTTGLFYPRRDGPAVEDFEPPSIAVHG